MSARVPSTSTRDSVLFVWAMLFAWGLGVAVWLHVQLALVIAGQRAGGM